MKFKIIAAVIVIVVVLLAIVIGTGIRNSATPTEGEPQTEVQPQ